MAEYKAIRGHTIRTIAGDASPLVTGDIWYSSTTRKIRGAKIGAGAWASGGNLNTAREYGAGIGTQTAALVACVTTATAVLDSVESYDGSSWSEIADTNTARGTDSWNGDGTQTAGIVEGGFAPGGPAVTDETEIWNGTAWTEVNDLNTAKASHAGTSEGTTTATLAFGGSYPSPHTATVESYNGTSWTEITDLNTSRERLSGCGTSTAALAIDGATTPGAGASGIQRTESWNGTAWTEVADTSTVHYWGTAFGNSTAALVAGSYPAATHTDEWNGTAWAEAAAFSTSRVLHNAGTGGPGVNGGIIIGGSPVSNATEEWTKAVAAVSFTSS
jgi:hypothetical protein